MSVTNRENARDMNVLVAWGLRLGAEVRTLAGDITLGENAAPVQYLDPGGAGRNVDLPASVDGTIFIIHNTADAAETITVRDEADVTVGTLLGAVAGTDEVGWFHRVNGAWRIMMIVTQS